MYSQENDNKDIYFEPNYQFENASIFEKKGFIFACVVSVIWLIYIGDYLFFSSWWENRYDLTPAEMVGHIGGLLFPIVVVFLIAAYFDRTIYTKNNINQIKPQEKEVVIPIQEDIQYSKILTDELRSQIKEFKNVFEQVNKETCRVKNDLRKWIDDLGQIISHVDTKTIASVQEIAEHIKGLTYATNQANDKALEVTTLFAEKANGLTAITQNSLEKMEKVSGNLQNQINDIQNLTHAFETTNNRTNEYLGLIEGVVGNMSKSSQLIEQNINKFGENTTQLNTRLIGQLEKILSVFKNQTIQMENEVQKITNRIGVIEDSLNNNAKEMLNTSSGVVNDLKYINESFEKTTDKVKTALKDIHDDVKNIEKSMEQTVQKAIPVFPKAKEKAQTDLLMDATVILNRLQAFSVDMAHIFTPKSEDSLWDKYYNGDKAVFMRHITKMMTETQNKKIIEFYHQNEDFRITVSRYMSEFEEMTKKAQEGEESKLLMSVLIGSDVGRLYMVLADVLKKEL